VEPTASTLSRDVLHLENRGFNDCLVLKQLFAPKDSDQEEPAVPDTFDRTGRASQVEAGRKLMARYPWKIVYLNNNRITDLLGLHLCTNLRKLDLSRNQIVNLPNRFFWRYLTNLQILYLHDNKIDSIHAVQDLGVLPNLTVLTMYGNIVEYHPAYRHVLVNSCPNLQLLDFYLVSDEELIEGASWGPPFGRYSRELEFVLQELPLSSDEDHMLHLNYHLRLVRERRERYSPVIRIQSWWRSILVRRTLRVYHAAAICIQRAWRRTLAQREAQRRANAIEAERRLESRLMRQNEERFRPKGQSKYSETEADAAAQRQALEAARKAREAEIASRTLYIVATNPTAVNIFNQLVHKVELQQQTVGGTLVDAGIMLLSPPDPLDDHPVLKYDRRRRNLPNWMDESNSADPNRVTVIDTESAEGEDEMDDNDRTYAINALEGIERVLSDREKARFIQLAEKIAKKRKAALKHRAQKSFCALRVGPRCTPEDRKAIAMLRLHRPGVSLPVVDRLRAEVLLALTSAGGFYHGSFKLGNNSLALLSSTALGASTAVTASAAVEARAAARKAASSAESRPDGGDSEPSALAAARTLAAMSTISAQVAANSQMIGMLMANKGATAGSNTDGTDSDWWTSDEPTKASDHPSLSPRRALQSLSGNKQQDASRPPSQQQQVGDGQQRFSMSSRSSTPRPSVNSPPNTQRLSRGSIDHVGGGAGSTRPSITGGIRSSFSYGPNAAQDDDAHADGLGLDTFPGSEENAEAVAADLHVDLNSPTFRADPLVGGRAKTPAVPEEVFIPGWTPFAKAYLRPNETLASFRARLLKCAKEPERPRLLKFVCPNHQFQEVLVRTLHRFNVELAAEAHEAIRDEDYEQLRSKQVLAYPHVTVRTMTAVVCIQSVWRSYRARKYLQPNLGKRILERRANSCLVRWSKGLFLKQRMKMLTGLALYVKSIDDSSLFMRGDAYQILRHAPNPFVQRGFFPEHRVICDVYTAPVDGNTISSTTFGLSSSSKQSNKGAVESQPDARRWDVALRSEVAVFGQAKSPSEIGRLLKACESNTRLENSLIATLRPTPYPIWLSQLIGGTPPLLQPGPAYSLTSGNINSLQSSSDIPLNESLLYDRDIDVLLKDAGFTYETLFMNQDGLTPPEGQGAYIGLSPIAALAHEAEATSDSKDVRGPGLIPSQVVPAERDDVTKWTKKSLIMQALQKCREAALELAHLHGDEALSPAQRKLLHPWERSPRDRLLNLISVGVRVELVRDLSKLTRDIGIATLLAPESTLSPQAKPSQVGKPGITPQLAGFGGPDDSNQIGNYFVKLTFASKEEARRRAAALLILTWDPRFKQNLLPLMTPSHIARIFAAREQLELEQRQLMAGSSTGVQHLSPSTDVGHLSFSTAIKRSISDLAAESARGTYKLTPEQQVLIGASNTAVAQPAVLRPWLLGTQERLTLHNTYWVEQEGRLTNPTLYPSDYIDILPAGSKTVTEYSGGSEALPNISSALNAASKWSSFVYGKEAEELLKGPVPRGGSVKACYSVSNQQLGPGSSHAALFGSPNPEPLAIGGGGGAILIASLTHAAQSTLLHKSVDLETPGLANEVKKQRAREMYVQLQKRLNMESRLRTAATQRGFTEALLAERRLKDDRELLEYRQRAESIRVAHRIKMRHIQLRENVMNALRMQERVAEQQELQARRTELQESRVAETTRTRMEARRAAEESMIKRGVALRDLRRQVEMQREEFAARLHEARLENERKLAIQRLERRSAAHEHSKQLAEQKMAMSFIAQQNMVARHLYKNLLAKEREKQRIAAQTKVQEFKDVERQQKERVTLARQATQVLRQNFKVIDNLELNQGKAAQKKAAAARIEAHRVHRDHHAYIKTLALATAHDIMNAPIPVLETAKSTYLDSLTAAQQQHQQVEQRGESQAVGTTTLPSRSGVNASVAQPAATQTQRGLAATAPAGALASVGAVSAAAKLRDSLAQSDLQLQMQIDALAELATQVKDRYELIAMRKYGNN